MQDNGQWGSGHDFTVKTDTYSSQRTEIGWTALQGGWIVKTKGNIRRQSLRQEGSRETDGQVDRLSNWRCQGLLGTPRDRRATKGGFKRENSGEGSCESEGPNSVVIL